MSNTRITYVYKDWDTILPERMGILYAENIKGKEIISFEYDENFLKNNNILLDPNLALYSGRQYLPLNKTMFGIFEDSSPDRWGRLLIKRREAINAEKEGRRPKRLTDLDFLLGVYDKTRMGGLRYSINENGPFLSTDEELATPPWVSLRELEDASLHFEKKDGFEEKWLLQLIAPGSSLGGARPKASVVATDGSLWIAKFPSNYDSFDVGAWEMVVHDLAYECGLEVPQAKIERFSKIGSTFLTKRFDRNNERRIHFSSAMTLLGKSDGASSYDGCSYLDVVSFIKEYGENPTKDLEELWKRIVFNMAVSNTDDHLRNHGFLLGREGWKLSPLYDVNPTIYGDSLSLNVDENNNMISFELALMVANKFGLSKRIANEELDEIKKTVENKWISIAKKYSINRLEIEEMSPAFNMAYKA